MDDIEIYHLSNGYTFFQYKHILLYLLHYICVCLHTHTYMKREYVYTHIYTHFKWSYPTQQIMSLLEAIGYQIQSPRANAGHVLKLLVIDFLETLETIQAAATVLGKALLLKTLHTLITGHEEIKLILTKKFPLCWLAFIALEGTI